MFEQLGQQASGAWTHLAFWGNIASFVTPIVLALLAWFYKRLEKEDAALHIRIDEEAEKANKRIDELIRIQRNCQEMHMRSNETMARHDEVSHVELLMREALQRVHDRIDSIDNDIKKILMLLTQYGRKRNNSNGDGGFQ